jgi:ABC-type antimicrobial peptide transport system permease subunit
LAAKGVFEDKRRSEYGIRHALGQTSRHCFAQNTAETLLTALLTTLAAAVTCPLGYIGTLALADAMGAAITLSSFNIPLCIVLLGLTFISVIIACAIRKPIRQNHKQYIQNTAERNSL